MKVDSIINNVFTKTRMKYGVQFVAKINQNEMSKDSGVIKKFIGIVA